jgi:hypothetical protein
VVQLVAGVYLSYELRGTKVTLPPFASRKKEIPCVVIFILLMVPLLRHECLSKCLVNL